MGIKKLICFIFGHDFERWTRPWNKDYVDICKRCKRRNLFIVEL